MQPDAPQWQPGGTPQPQPAQNPPYQPPVQQPYPPAPVYNPPQAPAQPQPQPTYAVPGEPAYVRPEDPGMHPMVVMQPGEHLVATVKRHPFGIVSLYISSLVGLALAAFVAFVLLPHFSGPFSSTIAGNTNVIYALFGLVVVVILLVMGISTSIYWQNQWVVTTDSITQISQRSLFGRQVSQLSMDNLEDVTVDQNGIVPHMFNYGTLRVETAGERSKFQFPYCPNPNDYARRILEVHEQFLEQRRNIQNRP